VTWRIEEDLDRQRLALPLPWYDVLIAVERSPERRLRMFELADAVVLSRTNLTRLVDRLEAAGLLRREPAPTDRRGAFAVITDAGRAALRRTWPLYAARIEDRFARHLSIEEAGVLRTVLERVLAAARNDLRDGAAETAR
jgi:DNA-binding MarR family transcriptional regulator